MMDDFPKNYEDEQNAQMYRIASLEATMKMVKTRKKTKKCKIQKLKILQKRQIQREGDRE